MLKTFVIAVALAASLFAALAIILGPGAVRTDEAAASPGSIYIVKFLREPSGS